MTKLEQRIYFLDNDYRSFMYDYVNAPADSIEVHIERLKRYMREGNLHRMTSDCVLEALDYFPEIKTLFGYGHEPPE